MRLLRVNVIACCFNVSVAISFEQDMCGASCLVCHCQFAAGENFRDMVTCLRVGERVCWNSSVDCLVTKWFHLTRLETRTKESNTYASPWVVKLVCTMKVIIEMLASVAD